MKLSNVRLEFLIEPEIKCSCSRLEAFFSFPNHLRSVQYDLEPERIALYSKKKKQFLENFWKNYDNFSLTEERSVVSIELLREVVVA